MLSWIRNVQTTNKIGCFIPLPSAYTSGHTLPHIQTHTQSHFISPHLKPGLEPWIMYLCKCMMGITIKDESDWKGILLDWVTAASELWMFSEQGERLTPLSLKKEKKKYFWSKEVTVSPPHPRNTLILNPISAFTICSARFKHQSGYYTHGQTIIDYEVAEDSDLSVYHLCNASRLPFLSNTELL